MSWISPQSGRDDGGAGDPVLPLLIRVVAAPDQAALTPPAAVLRPLPRLLVPVPRPGVNILLKIGFEWKN